jgi:hypothetical protein
MVCDCCGVISQESVVAHDYERNKDYNAEHYVLPTAEISGHKLQMLDGSLREVELKSKRKKFLKDKINRLKQPDADEFPMDVLECADAYIDRLSGKNYLRMKKDIILLHVLGAILFLSHEACNSPVELLHIKEVFQFEAIVPVSRQITRIRVLLDLTQPTMTMTQTFEYRLREALKKVLKDKISVGPKMMRALNTRVSKMMLMWKAIHDDAQHELMSRLSSKPNQCIYLYDHYLRKKMRKTCRKECIELHDCLIRLQFDFQKLKD